MITHTIAYNLDLLWQYLLEGDFLGFIQACYTSLIGSGFYAFVFLVTFGIVYIRTGSLTVVMILWTLLGTLLIGLAPIISPLIYIFWLLGITGTLFCLFAKAKE